MNTILPLVLLFLFVLTTPVHATDDPAGLVKAATEKKEIATKERDQLLTAAKLAMELAAAETKPDAKAYATAEFKKKAAAADAAAQRVELADIALTKAVAAVTAAETVGKDKKIIEDAEDEQRKEAENTKTKRAEYEKALAEEGQAATALKDATDANRVALREALTTAQVLRTTAQQQSEEAARKLDAATQKSVTVTAQASKNKDAAKKTLEAAKLAGFKVDDAAKVDEEEDEKKKEAAAAKEFSPFRLWVGTNLDLLDGVKTAKFYGNIDFTTPITEEDNHILFSIGAFQNRSISVDSTSRPAFATDLDFSAPVVRDSISVVRTSYTNKPTSTINSLGFYSIIGWRILNNGNSFKVTGMGKTINTVNGYIALRTDIIRREYITDNKYDIIKRDTSRVALVNGRYRLTPLPPDRITNRIVGVIQVGVPLFIVTESLEMRFSPFVGISLQEREAFPVATMSFNVTEKALGLSIGGEVRTLFRDEPPLMNLYIAKSFTIKDFKDLIKFN